MRQIEMAIQFVLKLLFSKQQLDDEFILEARADSGELLAALKRMTQNGALGEAEDLLFDNLEPGNLNSLRVALVFYSELNACSDDFLEQHDFSRAEVASGLRDAAAVFGVDAPGLFYDEY